MKTRIIQTRFWQDAFIADLSVKSKLLFIYCLSNERLELTGAFEVPLRYIATETGLSSDDVLKGFNEINPKIIYKDGYVIIRNHKKFQDYSKGNENQKKAYEKEFNNLPLSVQNILNSTQLVDNQSESSSQLDINKKPEIRNKKPENSENFEILEKEEMQLKEIVDFYNQIFNKNTISTNGFKSNYFKWCKIHNTEKIKIAIQNARLDKFWSDKLTLTILFRVRNPRGENVDMIEDLANRQIRQDQSLGVKTKIAFS